MFFCKGAIFHFQQCASVFLNPSYFSNYPNLLFLFLWAQSFHNNPSIVFFRFCAGSGQFLKKQLFTSNSWFPFFEAQSFFIWGPLPFTRRGLEGGLKGGLRGGFKGGLQGGASRGASRGGLRGGLKGGLKGGLLRPPLSPPSTPPRRRGWARPLIFQFCHFLFSIVSFRFLGISHFAMVPFFILNCWLPFFGPVIFQRCHFLFSTVSFFFLAQPFFLTVLGSQSIVHIVLLLYLFLGPSHTMDFASLSLFHKCVIPIVLGPVIVTLSCFVTKIVILSLAVCLDYDSRLLNSTWWRMPQHSTWRTPSFEKMPVWIMN